jgi:hypothetical protein
MINHVLKISLDPVGLVELNGMCFVAAQEFLLGQYTPTIQLLENPV